MGRKPVELSKRFWNHVDIGEPDECWIWHGRRTTPNKSGYRYGQTTYKGHLLMAHRAAYILANGEFPLELEVCHACDNPLCVNPKHLWLGTHSQNIKDCHDKGRHHYKPGSIRYKLADKDVYDIRRLIAAGEPTASIAKRYNVNRATIWYIKNGRTWKDLK